MRIVLLSFFILIGGCALSRDSLNQGFTNQDFLPARMMPLERQRFYRTVRESGANNLVLVSGDRHSATIYERGQVLDYPLFEMTTSSLNLPLTTWAPDPVEEPGT